MSKYDGPKVVLRQQPQELVLPGDMTFNCPACGAQCKTNAKLRTLKHALPTCKHYDQAVSTKEGPGAFLVEAGICQPLPPDVLPG